MSGGATASFVYDGDALRDRVKGTVNGVTTASFRLCLHDGTGGNQACTAWMTPSGWTQASASYTANATGKARISLQYSSSGSGAIYVDEVALAPAGGVGDERTTHRVYAYNASPSVWIVNKPGREKVCEGLDRDVSGCAGKTETRYYYDGNVTYGVMGTRGLLTQEDRGPDNSGQWAQTQYQYSDPGYPGNLTRVTDPLVHPTTIAYDTQYHIYPTTITNAQTQTTTYEYYGVAGITADNGLPGQLKKTTDPNSAVTEYRYDTFGRLTRIKAPDDPGWNDDQVSTRYVYRYDGVVGRQSVATHRGRQVGGLTVYWEEAYYDGLGRTLQVHKRENSDNTQEVRVTTTYDARGLAQKATVLYYGTQGEDEGYGTNGYVAPAGSVPGTTTQYDALGRVSQVTAPDNTTTRMFYRGWQTAVIDANSHQKISSADAYGRLITVQEYDGTYSSVNWTATPYATTRYAYDTLNNLRVVTDTLGNVTTMNYDPLGRKTSMTDPDMGAWSYTYDAGGNLVGQIDAKRQMQTLSYDALGRPTSKLAPDAGTTYLYDTFDTQNTTTWAWSGHQTVPFNDGGNNVAKNTGAGDACPYCANFYRNAYSLSSGKGLQLRFKVDSNDTIAHFAIEADDATYRRFCVYAADGKLHIQYVADGVNWVYPADLLPNVQVNTWYVLQITVDDVGGSTAQVYQESDPSVRGFYRVQMPAGKNWRFHHWIYRNTAYLDDYREFTGPVYTYDQGTNGIGRRTSMGDVSGSASWTYDLRGRMTNESRYISSAGTFNTSYAYDAMDRVITMTYPGEVVTQTYNAASQLSQVRSTTYNLNYASGLTYNAMGQIKRIQYSNGQETRYNYFGLDTYGQWGNQSYGRLFQTCVIASSDPNCPNNVVSNAKLNLSYWYDNVGNMTAQRDRTNDNQIQWYTYDALDRLVRGYTDASQGGGTDQGRYDESYAYDSIGNILSKGGVGSYSYPNPGQPRPHAATAAGTYTYTYDANGNMTTRAEGGATYRQGWDTENRLAWVDTLPSTTWTDGFDSLNSSAWAFSGHQTLEGGALKNSGAGDACQYCANFYRSIFNVNGGTSGQGIQVEFKVDATNTSAHFMLEADGSPYRRFGIVADGGKIVVQQVTTGNEWGAIADVLNPLELNVWYILTLKVAPSGAGNIEVWRKDDPSKHGSYALQMPAGGLNYRFHHWIYRGNAWLDNYQEINVQATTFYYDGDGKRVKKVAGSITTYTANPYHEETDVAGVAGRWHFAEGSGTTASDSSGNGNAATLNTPAWTAGVVGLALNSNGTNSARVPDSPSLRSNDITLAAWFKATSSGCIVCKQYGSSSDNSYAIWLEPSNTLKGYTSGATPVSYSGLQANQWYHGVFVKEGTVTRLYVNGVLVASGTAPATVLYDSSSVFIGADDNDNNEIGDFILNGTIDEVRIYNRALNAAEIQAIQNTRIYYYAGSTRVAMRQGGVVSYLHADHLGSASLTTEASGNKFSEERYYPYGETRYGSSPTDYQFTGQRKENGLGSLYDFQARHYSPVLGRFLSADTIVPSPGNPQSLNRYSYTLNNPVRYTDPTGHNWYDRVVGGLAQYLNDITLGVSDAVMKEATGVSMDQITNADYQQGREYGRGVSIVQGAVAGAGAAAGPPTAALTGAAAVPTGGTVLIPGAVALTAEGVMIVGGSTAAVHGAGTLAYIKNTPLKKPTIKQGSAGGPTAGQSFPDSVKKQAFEENPDKICSYCGRPGTGTQVDHVIPKSRGGNATIDNAQLACPHCNQSKGARDYPVTPPNGYRGPWPRPR